MLPKIWVPKKRGFTLGFSNQPAQTITRSLVLLGSKDLFIAFSNGTWLLYSMENDKIIRQGEVEHVVWHEDLVLKSPCAIGQDQILYMNFSTHQLECLDPYTGELDAEWTRKILKEGRSSSLEKKSTNTGFTGYDVRRFHHATIEVLNTSKLVGIIELVEYQTPYDLRTSQNYLFTVYSRNSKRPMASITLPWTEKNISLSKGNEEDVFIFWSSTHLFSTNFHIFSTKQKQRGIIKISFENEDTFFRPILYGCFPWQQNEIILFGQADTDNFPFKYRYNLKTQQFQVPIGFSHRDEDERQVLEEVLSVDSTKKNVLLTEIVGSSSRNIVLFNDREGRADAIYSFSIESSYIGDAKSGMIMEYERNLCEVAEEHLNKESSNHKIQTKITISRAVTLEIFLLYMLKNAKTSQGESFLQFYGNVYLAKSIAEMLRKY